MLLIAQWSTDDTEVYSYGHIFWHSDQIETWEMSDMSWSKHHWDIGTVSHTHRQTFLLLLFISRRWKNAAVFIDQRHHSHWGTEGERTCSSVILIIVMFLSSILIKKCILILTFHRLYCHILMLCFRVMNVKTKKCCDVKWRSRFYSDSALFLGHK